MMKMISEEGPNAERLMPNARWAGINAPSSGKWNGPQVRYQISP